MSFRYLADSLKIVTHRGVVISFPIFLFSTITCSDGVMSNTYCVVFSSCVPYVARFSGLSICDCPFGILWRLFIQLRRYILISIARDPNFYTTLQYSPWNSSDTL